MPNRENAAPMLDAAQYVNPPIPEGINASSEHPLKEFAWLSIGVTALLVLIVLVVGWLGQILGPLIPFEKEKQIADTIVMSADDEQNRETRAYLQGIADRLTAAMPLPDKMSVTLHVLNDKQANAFATLGGHIMVTQGLLDILPSENALAMVIAHEIAHVRERHVIRALGRGVLIGITLGILTGSSDGDLANSYLGPASFATALTFSRSQEHEADRFAVHNLHALYGHATDATTFFELAERDRQIAPDWLSTHPNQQKRITAIRKEIKTNGWAMKEEVHPLPEQIQKNNQE